ncbi:hypothetical protein BDY19DRAFT_992460 [Irpex rosettiformis]|uniref:Uncharacterized protein n=1 Tax=Irpex rosettiformis TaxID=378272 RepID=A0ACB8U7J6_9APHY|nr:hypothetical protein BDY19DRAFT_992460 [Irpex rosettiformis]
MGLSAPAPAQLPPYNKNLGRRATSEHLFSREPEGEDSPSRPAATPFFTPAVFFKDYHSQAPVVAAAPEPSPTPFNGAFMDPTSTEVSLDPPSPTTTVSDVSRKQGQSTSEQSTYPVEETGSKATEDAARTSLSGEVPSMTNFDTAEVATSQTAMPTLQAAVPSADPLPTPTPTPTVGHATSLKPSITKFMAPPTVSSTAPRTDPESERTQQSRKAAIIGALLALGSIAAVIFFVFCMRLPETFRRRFGKKSVEDHTEDPDNDKDLDPEKSFGNLEYQDVHLEPAQQLVVTPSNIAPVLPTTTASSPLPSNTTPANSPQTGWNHQWQSTAINQEVQFEDVTHILTDEATFAPHESDSESNRTSAAPTEEGPDRKSHGAPSVAHSYATCESRYSSPSVQDATDVSIADEQNASFHSAPSRSPSPPQTPEPATPRTPHQKPSMDSLKRPRSKTLSEEQASPIKKSSMSSSKSFPARFSNRSSEHSGKWSVLEQDSEWDIAAHYDARYSHRHSANPELGIIAENMETVDIGGRNCVLVQG